MHSIEGKQVIAVLTSALRLIATATKKERSIGGS
jgi:hypothetical protein